MNLIYMLLGFIILGGIIGGAYAIIIKVFGIESFSMWNHEWFNNDEKKDDFYKRF